MAIGPTEASEDPALESQQLYFALKFQQLTGPVMAKGVEDTTFYVYNRFLSANEVGGSVKVFGISQVAFHAETLSGWKILLTLCSRLLPTTRSEVKTCGRD